MSVICRRNKTVMLFGGDTGQRLEPVGIMCRALLYRPVLHGRRYRIGYAAVYSLAFFNSCFKYFICAFGQTFKHNRIVENHTAENLTDLIQKAIPPLI